MKVRVVAPHELSVADRDRWREILRSDPELGSPYFHPAFTLAVAAVRQDARVAVIEEGARTVGFFPFHRGVLGAGRPIGDTLSDYQAVIAEPDVPIEPAALMRHCGLAYWSFDHLLASQRAFAPFHRSVEPSPVLDLSSGFESYLKRRRDGGGERIAQLQRKARKLEREVGPLTLVVHKVDHDLLGQVIRWKSEQCRRTGVFDFFSRLPWTVPLVRRLMETEEEGFQGMLSALYAGGRLAAAHFGMRSDRVLHWWFPVFDPEGDLARHSPGGILLLRLAEHAAGAGLGLLDLGKGDDPYKTSFMTGSIAVAEGVVETMALATLARRAHQHARSWVKDSPTLAPARRSARALRERARRLISSRRGPGDVA